MPRDRPSSPRSDLLDAVALTLAWAFLTLGAYVVAGHLFPGNGPSENALCAVATLTVMTLVATSRVGWRKTGWTLKGLHRHGRLLMLMAVLSLFPLCLGVRSLAPRELGFLALAYALTGIAEEGWFRGIIQGRLESLETWRAAVVVGLLFGAVHLGNLAIRDNAAVVVAQAVGSGVHGFGLAVFRRRLGSIVPLVLAHFGADLALHLGRLPVIPMAVLHDCAYLVAGLLLLWGRIRTVCFKRTIIE